MSFANRIVGEGVKPASQFLANPLNWRTHPQRQRDAVNASLTEVGWVQQVIENVRTGHLVDGHERVWQAMQNGDSDVPFLQVDISEDEERLVLATLDPMAGMATADAGILADLLAGIETESDALTALLEGLAEDFIVQEDEPYELTVEAPLYQPTGERPEVSELYDDARTRQLVAAIQSADSLAVDEQAFLITAAQRHTVLRFDKIAEYYAHASAAVQTMMEDSALVIIDFDRAIELGFVKLNKGIADLVRGDYGD